MELWGDRRGQPVQIGFILLFGILVLAFASYQGYVVPNQNANIEFDHFGAVEDQFTGVDSAAVNAVGSDAEQSATVTLGTRYPSRLLALNPPPASGTLRTTDAGPVTFDGAGPICRDGGTAYTQSLVYGPDYNELRNAESLTYENRFVASTYRDGAAFGDQRLVTPVEGGNDRIDLLLLNGTIRENGERSYNVEVNGTHRYGETVTDPTIEMPSRFDATDWNEEILAGQSEVNVTDAGGGRVELNFTGGTYRVSCAVAGLGGDPAFQPPEASDEGGVGGSNTTYDTRWTAVEVDNESRSTSGPVEVEPSDTVKLTVRTTGRESGLGVKDPSVDYSFAYDVENNGSYGFGRSSRQISGSEDTIKFDVPDSSEARDGDAFEAYVDAGDDADVITFEVAGGTEFEYADGPRRGANNDDVVFTVENVGRDVSIASFEVRSVSGTDTFESFAITAPSSGTRTGDAGYGEGETVSHGPYDIATSEQAEYELEGFSLNMNNEDFVFVVTTEDGEEYEFSEEQVSS